MKQGGSKRPYKVWAHYGPDETKWSTIIHADSEGEARGKGFLAFLGYVGAERAAGVQVHADLYG